MQGEEIAGSSGKIARSTAQITGSSGKIARSTAQITEYSCVSGTNTLIQEEYYIKVRIQDNLKLQIFFSLLTSVIEPKL